MFFNQLIASTNPITPFSYSLFFINNQAPRFFKFNNSQRSSNALGLPMLTEFAVFQKTRDDDVGIIDVTDTEESDIEQEVCTSRITRLYGQDCKFTQGCTGFFTLKPVVDDDGL